MSKIFKVLLTIGALYLLSESRAAEIRIATFNVSMDASNYMDISQKLDAEVLKKNLATGEHPQIRNIAEIIQRVRPDILLLNEFDYIEDETKGVFAFANNYLGISQGGAEPIEYPYHFVAPSNTGMPSPFDLDRDGIPSGVGGDAWGFGMYPGQYGMLVLSKWPIDLNSVRTFQAFRWSDMPYAMQPNDPETGEPWYSPEAWQEFPLSSKSHWDLPIDIDGRILHFLVSHPTPPVFDGEEDRNGKRNHDEIRFWADYIDPARSDYIYDDKGKKGGLEKESRFVIAGDLNASAHEGDPLPGAIEQLLQHPAVNYDLAPERLDLAGSVAPEAEQNLSHHTAAWRAQVDYVLPSERGISLLDGAVFWPSQNSEFWRLIESREASSDHRLVWIEIEIID